MSYTLCCTRLGLRILRKLRMVRIAVTKGRRGLWNDRRNRPQKSLIIFRSWGFCNFAVTDREIGSIASLWKTLANLASYWSQERSSNIWNYVINNLTLPIECAAMVIISKATLRNFIDGHPDAEGAMEQWYSITKEADWRNFAALRKSFNSTDAVGNDRYVFNIRGNTYRLIALIIFKVRTVYILFVGTHNEYDQVDAATVTFKK